MINFTRFHRFSALALAMALGVPMSVFAETRRLSQTLVASQVIQTILTSRQAQESAAVSRKAVLDAMNRERKARGLRPLRLDARLNAAADDRMRDMFEKGYFNHVSPDGTQPFVWVKYRNYQYSTVGENLAEGYRSAEAVVSGWMNSAGHRHNLLGESFEDCGVAIVRGSPTGRTNGYTAVALYGRQARTRTM